MIGRTIDRYRVVELLGKGGMGVVYKARDTLLDRYVAIKVLHEAELADPDRQRRFLQEAKSASALNHPGIVSVYDVLTVDGQNALVMEWLEGETLEELSMRKRPTFSVALGLCVEIADALASAHAAGIVHRDLKPSNVIVTHEGAKVLDFGLAKLVGAPLEGHELPTIAMHRAEMTEERIIVGTVGWMSPEQAAGDPVDARSDIFAFGVLMYELLTGKHPFRRSTATETLEAIRDEVPDSPKQIDPELPQEAERAILRCLDKKPSRRWQSLADLGAILRDLKEDTESGRTALHETSVTQNRNYFGIALLALVVLAVAVTWITLIRPVEKGSDPLELRRLTYDSGVSLSPTISPEGQLVAFSSDRSGRGDSDIWLRHINRKEASRLTDHAADDGMPSFSPDGSRIVFVSSRDGGGIFVLNTLGGGLRKIATRGLFPRFSVDGSEVFFCEDPDWAPGRLHRMLRVAVDGGQPLPLLPEWGALGPPTSSGPVLSPDGKLMLFLGGRLDKSGPIDWWIAPIEGGEPWSSGAQQNLPRLELVQFPSLWLPNRLLLIAGTTIEGMNLYQAEISARGEIRGPVLPLTAGPGMSWMPDVSEDGQLVLSRFQYVIHLWSVDRDPKSGRPLGQPRRITQDASPKFSFSLARDGNLLSFSSYSGPLGDRRAEIRLQDRSTSEDRVVVSLPATTVSLEPRLSRDGSLVAWRNLDDGRWAAYLASTEDGVAEELCEACRVVTFFSNDAAVLVERGGGLSRIDLEGDQEQVLLPMEEGRALLDADLTSDDRWIALLTAETGGGNVAISVVALDAVSGESVEGMEIAGRDAWVGSPRWSPDGSILYYLSDRDDFICIWAQSFDPGSGTPIGDAFPIVHAHASSMKMLQMMRSAWALEIDGDRLVFNASGATGNIYSASLEDG